MVSDLTYFQRRAAQERAAALRAVHPRAQQAHLILAQGYEGLIRRSVANQPTWDSDFARPFRAHTAAAES